MIQRIDANTEDVVDNVQGAQRGEFRRLRAIVTQASERLSDSFVRRTSQVLGPCFQQQMAHCRMSCPSSSPLMDTSVRRIVFTFTDRNG